jgi:hypothetical protein
MNESKNYFLQHYIKKITSTTLLTKTLTDFLVGLVSTKLVA